MYSKYDYSGKVKNVSECVWNIVKTGGRGKYVFYWAQSNLVLLVWVCDSFCGSVCGSVIPWSR